MPTKSWKNHPQKLLRNTYSKSVSPIAAQTAQTEEFTLWLIDQIYKKLWFQTYNKEIGKFFFILRLGRQKIQVVCIDSSRK